MSLKLLTMRQLTNLRYEVKRQHASMLADAEEIMSQTDGEYDSPEFVSICKEIEKIEKEIERVNREITHRNVAFEHIQRALAGPLRRTPKLKPRRGIGSY